MTQSSTDKEINEFKVEWQSLGSKTSSVLNSITSNTSNDFLIVKSFETNLALEGLVNKCVGLNFPYAAKIIHKYVVEVVLSKFLEES